MEQLSTLIEQTRLGNLEVFGRIVRRFQDTAYGYAYSFLGDFPGDVNHGSHGEHRTKHHLFFPVYPVVQLPSTTASLRLCVRRSRR